MKYANDDYLPLGYLLVAVLAGGLAYRACMTGSGFGNSPGNAWLAAFATTAILFTILLISAEAMASRLKRVVCLVLLAVLALAHLLAFRG